ncbi:MAG: tRNA (guanosine(18)-2'-O)-methyltransferase TrmH [Gemmatimonadota bacterium]|jgi:tRNA (guanosine-2'-O-)-methyltransferase
MTPERFERIREVLTARQPDLTVLMERVNKTHNFSAILRNCDAVGVLRAHAVVPDRGIDLHHATSAGTSQWVQVRTHEDTAAAVTALREAGFSILAAHVSDDAVDYREVDYTRPTAIMMGAELYGISDDGLEAADQHVVVPMRGFARSLNVSVATALLLFEAHRQRSAAGMYESSRIPQETFDKLLFEWAYPREARIFRERAEPYPALADDGSWAEGISST